MNSKKTANTMLAVVFGLFLLALALKYQYPDCTAVTLLYVCLEAALIGGIADWFAVTALFKRPLGFSWHTELIPRNRERIAQALTEVVETDLLSVTAIRRRMAGIGFVEAFINWVDTGGQTYLKEVFTRHGDAIWAEKDIQAMAGYLENLFKRNANAVDMAKLSGNMLKQALERGKGESLIDFILDELILLVQKPAFRRTVFIYMEEIKHKKARSLLEKAVVWLGERTDGINLEEAAGSLCDELLSLLQDLKDENHLIRQWLREKLTEVVSGLGQNSSWLAAMESWKQALVRQLPLTEELNTVVKKTADGSYAPASAWLSRQMQTYWAVFKTDKTLQVWFEARLKYTVYRLIKTEHHLIGLVVKSVLGNFSNSDLSKFVEVKAGQDLQWIRINGSIVGGIVGLLIYLFLHTIYGPYILPVLRG